MNLQRSYAIISIAALSVYISQGLLGADSTSSTASPEDFYLRNGDRVVFYGDSITDHRLYTTFVEAYVVTRFPSMDVSFVHSGWGGDRVTGGGGGPIEKRLERDVVAWNPTVVTIMLGMNDGRYRSFDPNIFATYQEGLSNIIKELDDKLPGVRITLIRPSPFDDFTRPPKFDGGYNAVLIRYGEAVEEIAQATNHQVADLNKSMVEMLEKAGEKDPKLATEIIPDRVHPHPSGHLVMAAALLEAWNAPSLVTAVTLSTDPNGDGVKVLEAKNTTVSEVTANGATLSWTQHDLALPMPLKVKDETLELVLDSSDVIKALNNQPLRVLGLTAPYYGLKIDGESAGDFSAEQLASGINLATLPTPMMQQAENVYALTLKRSHLHQLRWRTIQVPFENPKSQQLADAMPAILAAFDAENEAYRQEQRQAAQPLPHRYELIPSQATQ